MRCASNYSQTACFFCLSLSSQIFAFSDKGVDNTYFRMILSNTDQTVTFKSSSNGTTPLTETSTYFPFDFSSPTTFTFTVLDDAVKV